MTVLFRVFARRGGPGSGGGGGGGVGGGTGPVPQAPLVTAFTSPSGGQVSITIEAPTFKANGSALDSENIVRHVFYRATALGEARPGGAYAQRVEIAMPDLDHLFTGLSGEQHFGVTCESDYGESDVAYDLTMTL